MVEKSSGKIWSNIPQDTAADASVETGKKKNPKLESPILVTYYDKTNYNEYVAISKTAALNRGKVSAEKIDNGISVTYFFKNEEFSVTVDYTLREDNMLVSIDTSKITEGENVLVEKVSIAPYFCGIKNESEDTYLFMPSGSGTLVYPSVTASVPSVVSESVYGLDYSDMLKKENTLTESVRLPIYGAKVGDKATLAIIEQSAESADITVTKNDSNVGYATVYGSFTVRGYNKIDVPRNFASSMYYMKLYAEPTEKVMSIAFYPLSGDDANYNGMANKYREYLTQNADLEKTKVSPTPLEIKFLGGTLLKDHFLGISYKKLNVITSLEQAKETVKQLKDKYEFTVGLYGYGNSGLDAGKPAGALTVNNKLGGVSGLKDLSEFCKDEKIPLYMNFDLLRFDTSGSGINTMFDSAVAIIVNGELYGDAVTLKNDGFNTVIFALGADIADNATLSFAISGLTSNVLYIDNIAVGMTDEAAVFGDVNDDGELNAFDLVLVINKILGVDCELNIVKCDVNVDDNINLLDIVRLKKNIAKMS